MKNFTKQDIDHKGTLPRLWTNDDRLYDPLDWQKQGLQQTATGYGKKLITPYKIMFNNKLVRIYCTCYSNAGSCWIKVNREKVFIS